MRLPVGNNMIVRTNNAYGRIKAQLDDGGERQEVAALGGFH